MRRAYIYVPHADVMSGCHLEFNLIYWNGALAGITKSMPRPMARTRIWGVLGAWGFKKMHRAAQHLSSTVTVLKFCATGGDVEKFSLAHWGVMYLQSSGAFFWDHRPRVPHEHKTCTVPTPIAACVASCLISPVCH